MSTQAWSQSFSSSSSSSSKANVLFERPLKRAKIDPTLNIEIETQSQNQKQVENYTQDSSSSSSSSNTVASRVKDSNRSWNLTEKEKFMKKHGEFGSRWLQIIEWAKDYYHPRDYKIDDEFDKDFWDVKMWWQRNEDWYWYSVCKQLVQTLRKPLKTL